jgi:hypothetical protein
MPRQTLSAFQACQQGILRDCSSIYEPLQCDSSAPEKRASVLIRFGGGSNRFGPAGFSSLGVLTGQGIWTHDHFSPEYRPSGDVGLPGDNIAWIQEENLFIEFEGANGTVRALTSDLDISAAWGVTTNGSLLIILRNLYVLPGSRRINSLQEIGDPASLSPLTLNQLRGVGRPVTAVFAPGSALPTSWNDLCVGKGIALGIVSESIVRSNQLRVALSEAMTAGDSGGGVFVDRKIVAFADSPYNFGLGQQGMDAGLRWDILQR